MVAFLLSLVKHTTAVKFSCFGSLPSTSIKLKNRLLLLKVITKIMFTSLP